MEAYLKFDIHVSMTIFEEDGDYIAYSPVFDVSTQGETHEEAKENLKEALTAFIATCYDQGSLFDVLKESGLMPTPEFSGNQDLINIPLPLVMNKRDTLLCHA